MKQTLATLDLTEKPDQKITWVRKVSHGRLDQRVDLAPDEELFSPGPHHNHYGYAIASDHDPLE